MHKHNLKQGSREAGVCSSSSSPRCTRMSSSCAQRASIMASLANELVCRGARTCVNGEHGGIADNGKKVATDSPANKAAAMNVQQARRSNCVCSHGGCVRGGGHTLIVRKQAGVQQSTPLAAAALRACGDTKGEPTAK